MKKHTKNTTHTRQTDITEKFMTNVTSDEDIDYWGRKKIHEKKNRERIEEEKKKKQNR